MRHHNTVFCDLVKRVDWRKFDRLVAEHQADKHVRSLNTRQQAKALIFAQISGASSLREIEALLESHGARLYHAGCGAVARTTLADANARRPAAAFEAFFAHLAARLPRHLRREAQEAQEALLLLDSTTIRLAGQGADWARFSAKLGGVKVHMMLDATAGCPVYYDVSPCNINDITVGKQMPVIEGATLCFDLGYYDYGWWARLLAARCRVVTRFKKNTPLKEAREHPLRPCGNVLSDRIGLLPQRQAKSRKNPVSQQVRELTVQLETGKTIRVLTNDLTAPSAEIAAIYKRRWEIELFFRWIKQNLKIRSFLGRSENAVRIQIAMALITYLLIKLAHAAQSVITSPLKFTRLLRANLMHRKRLDRLLEPDRLLKINENQLEFQL